MKKKFLSSEEMYAIDQYTIEKIGIPSPVLMERAAYAVVLDLKDDLTKNDFILVLAGNGNNGADAIAVARMLFLLNFNVEVYLPAQTSYSKGMKEQLTIAENIELPIKHKMKANKFTQATYIVDGLFGIGLTREIESHYKEGIYLVNQQKQEDTTIISLDIPSGLSAVTGELFETVIKADYTYTFGFYKKGMDTALGQYYCGQIKWCDLGYPLKKLEDFLDIEFLF